MQHFFVEPSAIDVDAGRVVIGGQDYNHIKNVLRMRIGEVVSVSNGENDNDYRCEIKEYTDSEVILTLMFIKEDALELPAKVYLFQGLPKADKMELIIQKAVELGVYEIIPVATRRAVVKLDEKKASSKVNRWQAISEAAAKQSKRGLVPKVSMPMSFKDAVKMAGELEVVAIPYELCEGMQDTAKWLEACCSAGSIGVFIGPEGGFDEEEIALAKSAGIMPISLGRRILRTETAGMTTLSILMYRLEINGHRIE